MSLVEKLTNQFGPDALKRPMPSGDVYALLDAVTEAFQRLSKRMEAMEAHGVKYAGVWQRALSYRKGLVVTVDGSLWVALRDTAEGEQPGKALAAWQLAEKIRKRVPAGSRSS